jgi:lysophospholipase L1-like esterase
MAADDGGTMRNKMAALLLTLLVLAASLLLPLSAAGASSKGGSSSPKYYVSLGDSYSIGYQPDPTLSLRFGYTHYLVASEKRRGTNLTLVNFGCGGATTGSLLNSIGCLAPLRALNGAPYSTVSQEAAATQFIAAHRSHVALITISIGGNDITQCGSAPSPVSCVAGVVPSVAKNVNALLQAVRAAAGPGVPIVGLTYPDVILGAWVHAPVNQSLATLSVTAFRLVINPVLKKAYQDNGGRFVDVTRASGAYTPLTRTTVYPPYRRIPVAVADTCTYTWYCSEGNIHPHTVGYQLIAKLIVAALPKKLG